MKNTNGAATVNCQPRQFETYIDNNEHDTTTARQISRELLDRHLTLVAEAEESGRHDLAEAAHELWAKHDIGLLTLEAMMFDARELQRMVAR